MIEPVTVLIITPAHKAFDGLLKVYNEIHSVLCPEITWYIKDSGQCNKTAEFFKNKEHIYLNMQPDQGIYDAINIALKSSQSSHYLVIGADDSIQLDVFMVALDRLKNGEELMFSFYRVRLMGSPDIISYRDLPLQWSNASLMPSHSAGTIISRSAHVRFGFYSTEFKILGDALFVLNAVCNGAKYSQYDDILGSFELGGISSAPSWLRVREWYLYQSKVFGKYNIALWLFLPIKTVQFCFSAVSKKASSVWKGFL